jgi:hypothetical protein
VNQFRARHSLARCRTAALFVCGLAFAASLARAEDQSAEVAPTADQCISFHVQAQALRRDGEFTAATERLRQCLLPECSPLLRNECASLLDAIERATPTVVFAASLDQQDLLEVTVREGERVIATRLDGRPISFDPGPHVLRFEAGASKALEHTLVLRAGEKNRLVSVVFEVPKPPASTGTDRRPSIALTSPSPELARAVNQAPAHDEPRFFARLDGWDYALLGASAASLIGGTASLSLAVSERRCRPDCSAQEAESVQRKLVVADVLFGASGALLAVTTIRYFVRKTSATRLKVLLGPSFVAGNVRF